MITMTRFLTFIFMAASLGSSLQTPGALNVGSEEVVIDDGFAWPPGYRCFWGLNCYKLYNESVKFVDAKHRCEEDGAHLAIINSKIEANALVKVYLPFYEPGQDWPRLGFGDFFEIGEYRTIFDQHINSTGYIEWYPEEPRDEYKRNCGAMNIEGKLGTQCCDCNKWFMCELERNIIPIPESI